MNHEPYTLYLRSQNPVQLESGLTHYGVWFDKDKQGEFRFTKDGAVIAFSQAYPFQAVAKCRFLEVPIEVQESQA